MIEKYRCGYCGAEYETPLARARCELECDEKQKQEIEQRRREEVQRHRNERLTEIKRKYDDLECDVRAYGKDYDLHGLAPIMRTSRLERSPFWVLWT